jgi:putative hydrolase of the HAD superfamily
MKKIKAILLDADGVLLKKQRYFSEVYSEQYGVPIESVALFFRTKFGDCQRGTADTKEELMPFLDEWQWKGSVEEFLDYWFTSGTEIDEAVLGIVDGLRKRGLKCYLTTDQERYRGEYIRTKIGLEKHLDGFFFSCDVGYPKSEKEFFHAILKELKLTPSEVLFFDDEQENIDTAKALGIASVLVSAAEGLNGIIQDIRAITHDGNI